MKRRYLKHLERMVRRSPVIAFGKHNGLEKNAVIEREDITRFSQVMALQWDWIQSTGYKQVKEEMYANLLQFTDNYLLCGGHEEVYLLTPLKNGNYKVVEKEHIGEWRDAYWKKEDPNNQRDWCYYDEDINDLFEFILERFDKYNK